MPITVLDPTSGPIPGPSDRALPPRPATLAGATVGLVANGLGRGEVFFDALYRHLADLPDAPRASLKVLKQSVSVPPAPGDWSRLTEGATVAITGFGG